MARSVTDGWDSYPPIASLGRLLPNDRVQNVPPSTVIFTPVM